MRARKQLRRPTLAWLSSTWTRGTCDSRQQEFYPERLVCGTLTSRALWWIDCMGNSSLSKSNGTTIHLSLARHRSTHSSRSYGRSYRRASYMNSVQSRASVGEPFELLPHNLEHLFELDVMPRKMIRNLCGCIQPLGRVDVVVDPTDSRRAVVDRLIALHANASELQFVRQELRIHCYLTQQHIVAATNQKPHPHLILLYGFYEDQQTLHILTEYYVTGSILSVILPVSEGRSSSPGRVQFDTEHDFLRAARQLCAAVAFMHEEGVAHMDISLENIFVDATGSLRLGDFRHSVFVGKVHRRKRVAPLPVRYAYGAPELYTGREVDLLKADVWSVGIVLTMLLTKKTPVGMATTQDKHYRLLQVLGVPAFIERMVQDTDLSKTIKQSAAVRDFVRLLADLLECEPEKRLSISEALVRYPWLAMPQYDKEAPRAEETTTGASGPTSAPQQNLLEAQNPPPLESLPKGDSPRQEIRKDDCHSTSRGETNQTSRTVTETGSSCTTST